ncbi:hypothetical protein Taro_054104, partial [Colocasia esculenta]|nr:hypothetical protein [Colocasia esculenta]
KVEECKEFFRTLYKFIYILGTYLKPHVAILNGITMGGGGGISIPGTFRIATEKSTNRRFLLLQKLKLASILMPGLPSIFHIYLGIWKSSFNNELIASIRRGARSQSRVGRRSQKGKEREEGLNSREYLALTGEKLNGVEMVACGLATHYSLSERLGWIEDRLGKLVTDDPSVIETSLEQYSDVAFPENGSAVRRFDVIDKCFGRESVEEIIDALETEADAQSNKLCASALRKLKEASPLNLKVSLRSIREARYQSLDQCLVREYRMSLHGISKRISNDFSEGVRAQLVDKDFAPKWDPPTLEEVSDDMVDFYFSPLGEFEPELKLPTQEAFLQIKTAQYLPHNFRCADRFLLQNYRVYVGLAAAALPLSLPISPPIADPITDDVAASPIADVDDAATSPHRRRLFLLITPF